MKLTKSKFKQIIQEELSAIREDDDSYWGKYEAEEHPAAPWDEPESDLTPEQQKVLQLCEELTVAVYDMERSDSEMTDSYIALFRALSKKGLNLDYMAKIA